ncbi:MAG TPA: magnesium transporter [Phycisphaerales bacterium]|nr:magnesium transporter [Phycisphaerales bacterium]
MNPTAALLEPEVLELIRAKQFAELREILHGLPLPDVADIFCELSAEDAAIGFRILPTQDAGEVFSYLPPEKQEELIQTLGDAAGALPLIEAMDPDDRVKLLDELPPQVAGRIVASLSPEERASTQSILGYPPRSVGRLMTPDYVRVRADWNVGKAIEHIRKYGRDAETVNVVYVVDENGLLVDDIRLRQLIMADPSAPLETLMNRQFVTLRADQPQEEAVLQLQRYDRVALPVVDSRGHLLGIVTHDDLADVAQEEATEDMQKMGGVQALEEPFLTASVFALFKKRAPWLGLLFLSELLTSNAIAFFEDEIQRAAILATFIPGIISSGGNSGSQASTLVIRAMSLREIMLSDWWRVLRRELIVAGLLGLMIGVIGLIRINTFGAMGWFKDPDVMDHFVILSVAISVTLVGVVVWGSIMGAMLPFVLKKCKLDPAGSSTPFVATLVDVTGIVIYFSVAIFVLRTTLLRPDAPDRNVRASTPALVVAVEPFNAGDKELDLEVDVDGKRGHVTIPASGLDKGLPPKPGDRVIIDFSSQKGEALRPAAQ